MTDSLADVAHLASWSDWIPVGGALDLAPRLPGVYLARSGRIGPVVYVGMAGERSGGGKPQGLRGRLAVYLGGKALTSGLGEAVFDRAIADPRWVEERVREAAAGTPLRAIEWGRLAIVRADLDLCWATTCNAIEARDLEGQCLAALADADLWNRRR
jgi:hypothetical protein